MTYNEALTGNGGAMDIGGQMHPYITAGLTTTLQSWMVVQSTGLADMVTIQL